MKLLYLKFTLIILFLGNISSLKSQSKNDSPILVSDNAEVFLCFNLPKQKNSSSQKFNEKSTFSSKNPIILESRPGANSVIYLDFDGEIVEDSYWNFAIENELISVDVNPINAQPSPYNDADITTIWEIMVEDFSPFDINITTDRSVYDDTPVYRRLMVIFTPTTAAIGSRMAGGVAKGRSFRDNSDNPAWVFTKLGPTTQSPRPAGQVGSHEVGHAMSLNHDGIGPNNGNEYIGHVDWAPIMGLNNQKPIRHWSKGEYNNASNTQDDIDRIANHPNYVYFVPDDHGNETGTATALVAETQGNVSSDQNAGIIEQRTDRDMFSFVSGIGEASFTVNQFQYTSISNKAANLDIKLRLLNTNGNEIAVSNPSASMNATITENITSAGTYYLEIDGVGTGNVNTGYSDYGSLGQYSISGTYPPGLLDSEPPTAPTNLTASSITATTVDLNWTASTDNIGVTEYDIYNGTTVITAVNGTSFQVTGLSPNTAYDFTVVAKDAAGNESSQSNVVEVNTPTLPCTTDVTISGDVTECSADDAVFTITGAQGDMVSYTGASGTPSSPVTIESNGTVDVTFDVESNTSLLFNWENDCGSFNETRFIFQELTSMSNNSPICAGSDAIFTFKGVPDKVITYTGNGTPGGTVKLNEIGMATLKVQDVTSNIDIGYNEIVCNGGHAELSFITLDNACPPDTIAPTRTTNLRFADKGPNAFELSWMPSSDNIGVSRYDVYIDGVFDGTTTDTSYSIPGALIGTPYTVAIVAVDALENESTQTSMKLLRFKFKE